MGFLGLGRKQRDAVTLNCLCIGEDRTAPWRKEESTGNYLQDPDNRLAYDSCPDAIAPLVNHRNGIVKYQGQCAILYEGMSRPFNFKTLNWVEGERKKDVILGTAVSEGCSMAVQQIVDETRFNKTVMLLMLALGIMGIMGFLAAWHGGLFSNIGHLLP